MMTKILLIFVILGCMISIITSAVMDMRCYGAGCSKTNQRCNVTEDCCKGFTCHPRNSSFTVASAYGCVPNSFAVCYEHLGIEPNQFVLARERRQKKKNKWNLVYYDKNHEPQTGTRRSMFDDLENLKIGESL